MATPMETGDDNTDENQVSSSVEGEEILHSDIDVNGIYEVLIRRNRTLRCECIFNISNADVSEFQALNELLPRISKFNRQTLRNIILPRMGGRASTELLDWLINEKPLFVIKFLPYLSMACDMNFYQCTIETYDNRRVFVPIERNHIISKAIYYICDASGRDILVLLITNHAYISQIHKILSVKTDDNIPRKIELYLLLINKYLEHTRTLKFHQHLFLLSKWQAVYNLYMALESLDYPHDFNAKLNYCRCLIMISRYSAAEEELTNLSSNRIITTDEVWYLLARAQRKRKKYPDKVEKKRIYTDYSLAHQSISISMSTYVTQTPTEEIIKEQTIINKLRHRLDENQSSVYTIKHSKNNEDLFYNILSVDGGGIRGIMAAIWLRELERKTKRTCSSMFQMMAGTSTGAIIAAGLSVPKTDCPTEPAYNASKLVELYDTCGSQIFIKKKRLFCNYRNISYSLAPKYSSAGRLKLFQGHFRDTLIDECLTDLVIPVVRAADVHTHLFTRTDCLCPTSLVDVLMATTAAPTYFNPHLINDISYVDGGVQMNNPTLAAYSKALDYGYSKENIYVLSLGTGDYIEDSSENSTRRDIFYYRRNRAKVVKILLDSQQHNVDYQMNSLMNDENYYRWQVWFEEPIELDKYHPDMVNKLKSIAYEYWEEMEAYDDNRLNRLIEHLANQ